MLRGSRRNSFLSDPGLWTFAVALVFVFVSVKYWLGSGFVLAPVPLLAIGLSALVLAVWSLMKRTRLLALAIVGGVLAGLVIVVHLFLIVLAFAIVGPPPR